MEFPVIHPSYNMRTIRYIYGVHITPDEKRNINGIVKYDLKTESAEILSFGDGNHSQEALFVPTPNGIAEDDGSLLTYVFNPRQNTSSLQIINATTMRIQTVIPLHTRVPMGFHTLFLSQEQLAAKHEMPPNSAR